MREELIKRARQFTAEHEHYEFYTAVAYSGYNHAIDKLNEMMATFAADVLAEREAEMRKLRVTWELGQWIRDRMSAPVHISPQSNKYWPV